MPKLKLKLLQGDKGLKGWPRVGDVIKMQSLKNLTMPLMTSYTTLRKQNVTTRTKDVALNPTPTFEGQKKTH